MMRSLLMATGALVVLSGCATAQTGEESLNQRLLDSQQDYCATASPAKRAVLLAVIRSQVPTYPESGLCTDAEQALAQELARQLETVGTVDMEQAMEDQRRAQEGL